MISGRRALDLGTACAFAAVLLLPAVPALAADEVHWTFTGPTSVTFDWRGPETEIRFGPTPGYGQSVTAVAPSPLPFSSAGPFREARLTGLAPNAVYHYAIGNGPDYTFRTPLTRGASDFVICVEGDIGDATSYPESMPTVQRMIAEEFPDFALLVGDLTYANDHGQSHVDQHFNDVMVWSVEDAYMPAWGNHEWDSSGDDFRNYKGRFDLPNPRSAPGAPPAGGPGKDWYWFDYGNVRFIAYPEPFSGAWAAWSASADTLMTEVDADPAIAFIVTFGHRPAYSSGHHPGDATLRGYMDGLGARHPKYVLDLCGHSHDYERTHPQNGVTHVTAGTGGASLETDGSSCPWKGGCPAPSYTAFRAFRHGPLRLRFTATAIEGAALCGPASSNDDLACTLGDAMDTFRIDAVTGGNRAPVIACPPAVAVDAGAPVAFDLSASDPDGDAVTLSATGLPRGASFAGARFAWTPDTTQAGSYAIVFHASDGSLASQCGVSIRVRDAGDHSGAEPAVRFDAPRPNPLVDQLTLSFDLPATSWVTLNLYSIDGRIRGHLRGEEFAAGHHVIQWDGRDDSGRKVPAGLYCVVLEAGGVRRARRITLVR